MNSIFISNSIADTTKFAQNLSKELKPGSVLALHGELGSGKTTFTQSLAKALGISARLTSPTFVIMRQYQIPSWTGLLYHFDFYRLHVANDAKSFDLNELIAENNNLIVIEWPEIVASILPSHTVHIYFETISDNERRITIK